MDQKYVALVDELSQQCMSGIAATWPAHQTKSITPKARAVQCMYGACPRTVQSVDWWSQLRLISTVHCPNATLDEWAQT
eukprot:COSAG02_NODE_7374_length_3043_cov_1.421053_3_plen_79_part_00